MILSAIDKDPLFRPIDRQLARYLESIATRHADVCAATAATVSQGLASGHAFANLEQVRQNFELWSGEKWPQNIDWPSSSVAGASGDGMPLVVDGDRFYLHRLWHAEHQLASLVAKRCPRPLARTGAADGQAGAVELATSQALTVITGGPGTGKTTTVAKILEKLALESSGELRVALAAPTGKAARRLQAAVASEVEQTSLRVDDAKTLHRLLGFQPERGLWGYGARRQLQQDVVIVDEASMIDLSLMRRLFEAVSGDAKLILLGDRDQLFSVEAGSVFADMTTLTEFGVVAELTEKFRFEEGAGISELADAIRLGDVDTAFDLLRADLPDVRWEQDSRAVDQWIPSEFEDALRDSNIESALNGIDSFRVLCGEKRDVRRLNEQLQVSLSLRGLTAEAGRYFHNQPLLISSNDYSLGLYNGEVGLVRRIEPGGGLRAAFKVGNEVRLVSTSRLATAETAFAMTIHKSQGSEYDEATVVLPAVESRVLSRELFYTGVTRAKQTVRVVGSEAAVRRAIQERIARRSSLAERVVSALSTA